MRWRLVEANDQIMPSDVADVTAGELRRRGVGVRTGTRQEGVADSSMRLSTGEEVPARTVVWTAGIAPSPLSPGSDYR